MTSLRCCFVFLLRLIMNAGRIQQEHDFSSSVIFHVAPKRLWIMPRAPTVLAGGIMFISWYLRQQARIGPIPARRAVQLYVESASNAFLIVAAKASLEVDCRKHMDVTSRSSSRDSKSKLCQLYTTGGSRTQPMRNRRTTLGPNRRSSMCGNRRKSSALDRTYFTLHIDCTFHRV